MQNQQKMEEASIPGSTGSDCFENNIVQDLERFGFEGFKREVSPFPWGEGGDLLKIDIAFTEVEERLALELDGPSHFLTRLEGTNAKQERKKKPTRDGPTKAKTRIMQSLGWKVSRHSYMRNTKLEKRSPEERKIYWIKKLGKFGVRPQS